nr:MAG: hypothetical protein DIU78_20965 [Pseudomonadota bacterium]
MVRIWERSRAAAPSPDYLPPVIPIVVHHSNGCFVGGRKRGRRKESRKGLKWVSSRTADGSWPTSYSRSSVPSTPTLSRASTRPIPPRSAASKRASSPPTRSLSSSTINPSAPLMRYAQAFGGSVD